MASPRPSESRRDTAAIRGNRSGSSGRLATHMETPMDELTQVERDAVQAAINTLRTQATKVQGTATGTLLAGLAADLAPLVWSDEAA